MSMIIVAAVVIIISLAIILYLVLSPKYTKISFKESIDLTNLPIITFYNNGNKLNFLLDTGSNRSTLNLSELDKCEYTTLNMSNSLIGLDGIEKEVNNVVLPLKYGKFTFVEELQVADMSAIFTAIKNDYGVTLNGILGNTFFTKYKYILDFDKLVAYSKKRL